MEEAMPPAFLYIEIISKGVRVINDSFPADIGLVVNSKKLSYSTYL